MLLLPMDILCCTSLLVEIFNGCCEKNNTRLILPVDNYDLISGADWFVQFYEGEDLCILKGNPSESIDASGLTFEME